jgi:DegV family protein with EDD domain
VIRIITDSSCDLPDDLVERHRITVVPLTIRFGDDEYIDREQLSVDRFWELLVAGEGLPETAAPSVGRFQEAFGRLSSGGADAVVVICLSSAISATCQSAVVAVEQYGGGIPIRVLDSRLVSGALGLVVLAAAEAAESGGSLDEVEAVARNAADTSNLLATLDTLEYLKRGGRIGSAAAFFGNLLDVKPLISFQDGQVHAAGRVRTRRKAVASIVDFVRENDGSIAELAIIHSDPSDLDEFTAALAEIHPGSPSLMRLGPVVGTHAGPGVVGVAYRLTTSA